MNNNPIISVIIPIFNSEKYLPHCVESVINQTYKELEIVLVNDGSTDNSKQICENYAIQDKRIKLVNKKNGGLGSARVAGIANSTGEYLSFVDSDDWIDVDTYSKLCQDLFKYKEIDIVIGGYIINTSDGECREVFEKSEKKYITSKEGLYHMFDALNYDWSLCDKLYKCSLFDNKKLIDNWPDGFGEDTFANWILFKNSKKILYVPIYGYHYFMHENSMTHLRFSKKQFDYFTIYDELINGVSEDDYALKVKLIKTALSVCLPILFQAEDNYKLYENEIKNGILQIKKYHCYLRNFDIQESVTYQCRINKIDQSREEAEAYRNYRNIELVDFADRDGVYIYGAGKIADELFQIMVNLKIKIKGVVVSKKSENHKDFHGVKISPINDIIDKIRNEKVVLALNKKNSEEVISSIANLDFVQVFDGGKYSIYY